MYLGFSGNSWTWNISWNIDESTNSTGSMNPQGWCPSCAMATVALLNQQITCVNYLIPIKSRQILLNQHKHCLVLFSFIGAASWKCTVPWTVKVYVLCAFFATRVISKRVDFPARALAEAPWAVLDFPMKHRDPSNGNQYGKHNVIKINKPFQKSQWVI